MKVELVLGAALLTGCSGGSGQSPSQSQRQARAATEGVGDVAGGETSEFSGDFGTCPEIASSEPLDLADPEVASWVAMAQGHHEQTLGWRRLVLSDEVVGFEEHTSVSIDVKVLRGRDIVYGSGGETGEIASCHGLRGRQIELEITLATADGAVATTFRNWFQPGASDLHGMVLHHHGFNPDNSGNVDPNVTGTLELRLDPALGGTPGMGVGNIEFAADSVQGTLTAGVSPEVPPELGAGIFGSSWMPIEGISPDNPCGNEGRSIGLDEYVEDLGATPRAHYQGMAMAQRRGPIPAVWKSSPYGVELSPLDVPPPTQVSLDAGEPTRACVEGGWVTVYAPLTLTTADGRVNLTQPFTFLLSEDRAYVNERTPWVPAADFGDPMGLGGVNLERGYGSIYFQNQVDSGNAQVEGSFEVSQWEAFTDRVAAYPVLEWCTGGQCIP